MAKPPIEVKSQWRHKSRPSRKVRVTNVWTDETMRGPGEWGVSFDISDPERDQQPWRDSSVTSAVLFLEEYEPDASARAVLQDGAADMVAELIAKVEENVAPELATLRGRIDNVLQFLEGVTAPNMHTLSHIRRMLTIDDKY
jgi:hypothetical protein